MVNWAYIAGFFDGEGSANMGRKSVWHLSICQSGAIGKECLREIQAFWAANGIHSTLTEKKLTGKLGKKPMWYLGAARRNEIVVALQYMLPFLHIKKVLVQDLLRYHRLFRSWTVVEHKLDQQGRRLLNGKYRRF